jgi:hypothetical protein
MKLQTIAALVVVLSGAGMGAESHPGAAFGARDPAICASRKDPGKGAPSAEQARTYFFCDSERMDAGTYGGNGSHLYLVTDVKIDVASRSRPFNPVTDTTSAIDPTQPVYNIRGSYAKYQCMTPGAGGGGTYPIGKNCNRYDLSNAVGMCYKDTFSDWHCVLLSGDLPKVTATGQPAPGR